MKKGFTLLELSIVLVIIGLIIGGITAGADLIRGAELNSLISQKQKIDTAIHTFKLKYNALPGDMDNATAYWGAAHTSVTTCRATASTGVETCDGDGNGIINVNGNEIFRFWQHLANAGLVKGTYDGVSSFSTVGSDASNALAATIDSGLWTVNNWASRNGVLWVFDGDYDNVLQVGAPTTQDARAPLLTPAETYNIDLKYDDGMPAKGKMVVRPQWASSSTGKCENAANTSDLDAEYALSTETAECAIVWKQAF